MAPFTLSAVRPISMSGSMEMSKPINSSGKPNVDSTTIAANVAPPPTPAMPNEEMATTKIKVRM